MRVDVFFAPHANAVLQQTLALPEGSTVADALTRLGAASVGATWRDAVHHAQTGALGLSLWSRRVELGERLREGDRLELSRPLLVDPKVARRERFKGQGNKTTGLFSKKRPGAKAGY